MWPLSSAGNQISSLNNSQIPFVGDKFFFTETMLQHINKTSKAYYVVVSIYIVLGNSLMNFLTVKQDKI
ncbi:hypothetical protein BBI01_01035 [Chryseobacterium artocarpi]|uniref:Uncharacterized protein n=1 Tax=Chryseobacterium artocarpi TaxID=1414727 RepID=A0A1B8ZZS5_9FLAO|nr:hypothetical protein BBI01_01035 [Chryseobacterium artocarpi]